MNAFEGSHFVTKLLIKMIEDTHFDEMKTVIIFEKSSKVLISAKALI
jgi:hypothetical protein